MNRSRQQIKAAKARSEWRQLQEQKLKEEQQILIQRLKKKAELKKSNVLRNVG